MINALVQFIADPSNDYVGHSLAYIRLSVSAILLAIVISVPLGVIVSRSFLASFIAVNISGLMRAIPVLAFLAAAYPYLGFGFKPSLMALTILGIPPILLNTYTGIRGVDPASIDHIEVIRGPQAATIYGSDAIGGVMQIFTKKGSSASSRPARKASLQCARPHK